MNTVAEIKQALERLPSDEREAIAGWLQEFEATLLPGYRIAEPRSWKAVARPPYMTVDEYLEFEETSPIRHEYVNGAIYAMNGVSVAHARITRELASAFREHLRGGPCEPFSSDLKLQIRSDTDEVYYYPDVMVACDRQHWGPNYVPNPKLVAEILSPSTRHIDLREKAMTYRRIASLEEYVVLAQDDHQVTVHRRAEKWRPVSYSGPKAKVEFRSIGLSVPLAHIYEGTL